MKALYIVKKENIEFTYKSTINGISTNKIHLPGFCRISNQHALSSYFLINIHHIKWKTAKKPT